MSAPAGWYPDPGGVANLFRYWTGQTWSAATSPNPAAPPPVTALGSVPPPSQPSGSVSSGQSSYAQPGYGQPGALPGHGQPGALPGYGHSGTAGPGRTSAYANYQAVSTKKKTSTGWWLGAAALLVVIVVVAAFVIRGASNGTLGNTPAGAATTSTCPDEVTASPSPKPRPQDGRVHGGPVSYPELGTPWQAPTTDYRVPFGSDVQTQNVLVEQDYDGKRSDWVASVLVGELAAGDGFFTPQQGSQIVVKCILGRFYGDNPVQSHVRLDQATTIDGHEGWLVESHLTFNIPGLLTKGELMIVAIVATGSTAGLYYASIPDTRPELVQPARDALRQLKVDG